VEGQTDIKIQNQSKYQYIPTMSIPIVQKSIAWPLLMGSSSSISMVVVNMMVVDDKADAFVYYG